MTAWPDLHPDDARPLHDLAASSDRYKLLISLVIPRPIALVTTLGPTGIVNAAPFSFFNMFSEDAAAGGARTAGAAGRRPEGHLGAYPRAAARS